MSQSHFHILQRYFAVDYLVVLFLLQKTRFDLASVVSYYKSA